MSAIMTQEDFRQHLATHAGQFKSVLPTHITPEKFLRVAMTAVIEDPGLLEADLPSLMSALTKCAKDGLIPDKREAAIVIYKTNVGSKQNPNWIKKAQYLSMVDGVLKRARQSGEIAMIKACVVHEGDHFDYWMDEQGDHVIYRPKLIGDRGKPQLAVGFARLKSGELMVEPLTLEDIDKIRKSSKTPDSGPWVTWWDRMAAKSALHRLSKRLPNNSEIMEMLDAGNFMYDQAQRQEKDVTPAKESVGILSQLAAGGDVADPGPSYAQIAERIKVAAPADDSDIESHIAAMQNPEHQKELTKMLELRKMKRTL